MMGVAWNKLLIIAHVDLVVGISLLFLFMSQCYYKIYESMLLQNLIRSS